MSNKEWLENCKKQYEVSRFSVCEYDIEFRKMKALEIIAEELIEFKEIINFALLHHSFMGLRKELVEAFGKEEVKKAEKRANEKTKK